MLNCQEQEGKILNFACFLIVSCIEASQLNVFLLHPQFLKVKIFIP